MANNLQDNNMHILQPSFTAGEISNEVSSRSDIQKYQSALLQAKNCYIRPYGAVYRRAGTKYCTATKYPDRKAILRKFTYSVDVNYYIEVGHQYIRIHRDGSYLGVELITPWTESDLYSLDFLQSADTMYICSGKYQVQELSRYTETDWRLQEFQLTTPYFEMQNNIELPSDIPQATSYSTAGTHTWTCTKSGYYEVVLAGGGGGPGGRWHGGSWSAMSMTASEYEAGIGKVYGLKDEGGFGGIGYVYNQPDGAPDGYLSSGGRGDRVVRNVYLTAGHTYSIVVGAGGAPGENRQVTNGLTGTVDNTFFTGQGHDPNCWVFPDAGTGSAGGTTTLIDTSDNNRVIAAAGGGAGGVGMSIAFTSNINTSNEWGFFVWRRKAVNGASAGNGQGGTGGTATYNNQYYYSPDATWMLLYKDSAVSTTNGGAGYATVIYSSTENGIANSITPSATTGDITLTTTGNLFTKGQENNYIKLYQSVTNVTVSTTNGTSASLRVGDSWKIITHGTWVGSVTLQKSDNNSLWTDYRKYTGNNDSNITESGTVEDMSYLRVVCNISSGSVTVDVTALPYTHEGIAKMTEYVSSSVMKAKVTQELGNTSSVTAYAFGAWCQDYGYPKASCFFQDRLCLANTTKSPYTVWFSKSGDYSNFGVVSAGGSVTDDSAIAAQFVSREKFEIEHLVPGTDLIVLTEGNEWRISGSSTVTPSNITPQQQTTNGSSSVSPQPIGGRIIYCQRRGGTVRDMGYSYESDNYIGDDLTLLSKDLVKNKVIKELAYKQEPDSTIFFVRNDGVILCLTYVKDQNVYAWSHLETQGEFESVASVPDSDIDTLYAVVKRTVNGQTVRYIESFTEQFNAAATQEFTMLDCSLSFFDNAGLDEITGLAHLAGATVDVLADGRAIKQLHVDAEGRLKLPGKYKNVLVGLQYESVIELPAVEVQVSNGTMQGRKKKISECILRLENSLGGSIGQTSSAVDRMQYDELSTVTPPVLFSGDKRVRMPNLPNGGFLTEGKVVITHDDPYPFNLSAIVRVVAFGG